jgi:CyaY protein
MTETEFTQRADAVLFEIGDALDESGLDCDWECADGILTIDIAGGNIIVNRHVPNREIWLASSIMGAAHFRFDGALWRDTRSDSSLGSAVKKAVAAQGGADFTLALP